MRLPKIEELNQHKVHRTGEGEELNPSMKILAESLTFQVDYASALLLFLGGMI